MLYFVKTPEYIKKIFPSFTWGVPEAKNKIYLTFDDGPTVKVTNWVLSELKKHNAKATFFCIGKNIDNHPEILANIINGGHLIGNHTQNHLNGWKTKRNKYVSDVLNSKQVNNKIKTPLLFRPPYGKIKNRQARALQKIGYHIIMWDVLSGDFDSKISKEKCLTNVLKNTTSGSIVVFHDSDKAFEKLKYVLPQVLKFFSEKGFEFVTVQK